MFQVPTHCPVCRQSEMVVTDLACPNCDSALNGRFTLPRLTRLTPDQIRFVETFILCEGKIKHVEEEMGLSYQAVKGRLEEVIAALNGQPQQAPAVPTAPTPPPKTAEQPQPQADNQRKEILARVSAGEISAAEAANLLKK